jgi:ATP-binding cassette subfamily F protein uup
MMQWQQFQNRVEPSPVSKVPAGSKEKATAPERQKRLSYLDRLEWDRMEEMILAAEEELESKQQAAANPAIASDAHELIMAHEALEQARQRIDQLYARWAELEAKLQERRGS